jgi:hypothetical protein
MWLTPTQRQLLRSAVTGESNELDRVLADLMQDNPDAFHTSSSLHHRIFINEPLRGEPCTRFLNPMTLISIKQTMCKRWPSVRHESVFGND